METKLETGTHHDTIRIGSFRLESGVVLPEVEIAYERAGREDAPAIFVCHALTGNQYAVGTSEEPGWWAGLIGEGKSVDTRKWQVITMNVLGGCDGSTGPASINPVSFRPYRTSFPFVTVRDIVRVHYQALKVLGIERLKAVIGASLGGMQALEWGILYPDFIDMLFPLAATPYLSDYAVAYNAMARLAIQQDPNWNNGYYSADHPPEGGVGLARMIGMVTYRSSEMYNDRFARNPFDDWGSNHSELAFEVESYLSYQGKKLSERFDANSYLYLLKAMDSHDIGRGRDGWRNALRRLKIPMYAFGFQGDLLYPPEVLKELANEHQEVNGESRFYEVETKFGHDGFLVEFEKWGSKIKECLHGD